MTAVGTRPRTGFLFPGQSSEYVGMGVELHREHPLFRAIIDRHADRFRRLTGVGPLDVFGDPAAQTRAELLQPAVFLLQVALAEFWTSCGVRPDAVVGHSLGEYAAACVAGVFDVEEGLDLVSARGRAFAAVPGAGRMVAVGGPDPAELERLVAAHGGAASVAAYNAPERVVVSGTDAAMGELTAEFERRGWLTIALETTHAFHSALVAPAVPALVAAAGRIKHRAPAVPLALNLTGAWAAGAELGAEYWGRQLTSPIRFAAGVRALMDAGCTVFLEVGSARTLTTAGRAQSDGSELWLTGLAPRTPDSVTVLEHLTRLEEAGIPVDWVKYHAPFRAPAAELPFRIERVAIHDAASAARSGVAKVRRRAEETAREVLDLSVLDDAGRPVVEVFGLELGAGADAQGSGADRLPPEEIDRGVTPMTDYDLRKKLEAALRVRAEQARTEHPLSYGQSSLLMMHQMDPDSASYNVALTARFSGGFDSAAFHGALLSLVGRHAALRTTFSRAGAEDGDGPAGRQIVHGWLEPDFAELDARQWAETALEDAVRAAYREPFALVSGSPLRVRVYRVEPGEAVVLMAAHHAVCDFWSLGTMLAELEQLYAAEVERRPAALPGRNKPYSDFVAYQRELISDARGARARTYWHERLSGELEPVEWPRFDLDPADADGGGSLMFPLPADLVADVFALAKVEAVTPYVVLLTAFQVLVGRYTGSRDVLVGSPFAGRTDPALADCVGNFMNPVVLRADLSDAVSFREQLGRTRRTVAEAFEHQDYPFELLVSELAPRRADGRNPIFQTMFIYQKSGRHPAHAALHVADKGATPGVWAGLTAAPFPLDKQDDQLELLLEVVHDGGRLVALLKYRKSVFSEAAAGRAAEHYVTLLRSAVAGPDRSVADLPLDSQGRLEIEGRVETQVPVAPRTVVAAAPSEHERRVTAVWQQVLQRREFGREDNFFDLGGTSMLLLQVYELLDGAAADPPLKGSELFRYPTVASLAARLGGGEGRDRDRTSSRRAARLADDTVRGARLRARERGGKSA
ncbi:MAG TPA: condensation domain-containing protein [Actinospica sp.]|nr:condensation domain-containing protein [Actinospica sp.]